jgi:hypothetical protein
MQLKEQIFYQLESFKDLYDPEDHIGSRKIMRDKIRSSGVEVSNRHFNRIFDAWDVSSTEISDLGYTFQDGYYYFGEEGELTVPEKEIDLLYYLYADKSTGGLGLAQSEVMQRVGLKTKEFNLVKKSLAITKRSLPIGPRRLIGRTPGDQQKIIAEVTSQFHQGYLMDSVGNLRNRKLANKVRSDYIKMEQEFFFSSTILENLNLHFKKPIEVITTRVVNPESKIEHLVINVADIHIGADVPGHEMAIATNTKLIRQRLAKIATKANRMGAKKVHIRFLGDLIESINGVMHPGTFLEMEKGIYMSQVIFKAVDIMVEFLNQINNLSTVHGVAGNHDRIGAKDFDQRGEAALIIYEIIKRSFASTHIKAGFATANEYYNADEGNGNVTVEYDALKGISVIDGIGYIDGHGDNSWIKKPEEQIIKANHYLDLIPKFWLIREAHKHHRNTKKDQVSHRVNVVPSIIAGNFFSRKAGLDSWPGFSWSYKDEDADLVYTDYTFFE